MDGEITCREAGRRGGKAVKEKFGKEFYVEIGQRGGGTTLERHGESHFSRIGKLGGQTTAARHGREHYEKMQQKGTGRLKKLLELGRQKEAELNGGG